MRKIVEEEDGEITSFPTNISKTHEDMEQLLQSNLSTTSEDPRTPGGQAKLPEMRMQAQVTPNKKSTQTIQPTFPSKGKKKKEEGIQP